MKLTGLKEILKASEIYGPTQTEGNAKIGVLKFAVKILERYLWRIFFSKPATLLKMNFLLGVFQKFWLEILLDNFQETYF